ncbi:MAG: hypothetical protein WDO68_04830 [Gammaproteobacteria bacterium]
MSGEALIVEMRNVSQPVSRGEYVWAKVVGVTLAFIGPWTVLLIAASALILTTRIPDGLVVFTTLIVMFALAVAGLEEFHFVSTLLSVGVLVGMTGLFGGLAIRRLARKG